MKTRLFLLSAYLCVSYPAFAHEDELCSSEQKASLNSCLSLCESNCLAASPTCEKSAISLEEVRAKISERCVCANAKNFGKYRSCVSHVTKALRVLSLFSDEIKDGVASDNAACKASIQARKRGNRG